MHLVRFTPSQLSELAALRRAARLATPALGMLRDRARSLRRRALPAGGAAAVVASPPWAVAQLDDLLDRCAAALRPLRRSA